MPPPIGIARVREFQAAFGMLEVLADASAISAAQRRATALVRQYQRQMISLTTDLAWMARGPQAQRV